MGYKTHLYEYHLKNARMFEFAGFEMPLWFKGIIEEHLAVRNSVGIFDVTHMGRCLIRGEDSARFLEYVLPRRISDMRVFQGRYTVLLNENGGIKDDLTIFRLSDNEFLIVYNAINRRKDFDWLVKNATNFNVEIVDISDSTPMYAVQGPYAVHTLKKIVSSDTNLSDIKRFWGTWGRIGEHTVFLTRSGYTGEDGFEIYQWDTPLTEAYRALDLWNKLLKAGEEFGIEPCGLGARDTLRLEAGYCLYDNDINEDINPYEARLDFTVDLTKEEDFIGKSALLKVKERGVEKVRVGVKLVEKGVPRRGCKIYSVDGLEIGFLTSGSYSPMLKCGIGMGYVKVEYSVAGTDVYVDLRGKLIKGVVSSLPFYRKG
ncbi:MAG: glycine cleavage system aminomethyltransferase GcvT [Candidatus Geothermarchaeota archaeon]